MNLKGNSEEITALNSSRPGAAAINSEICALDSPPEPESNRRNPSILWEKIPRTRTTAIDVEKTADRTIDTLTPSALFVFIISRSLLFVCMYVCIGYTVFTHNTCCVCVCECCWTDGYGERGGKELSECWFYLWRKEGVMNSNTIIEFTKMPMVIRCDISNIFIFCFNYIKYYVNPLLLKTLHYYQFLVFSNFDHTYFWKYVWTRLCVYSKFENMRLYVLEIWRHRELIYIFSWEDFSNLEILHVVLFLW